MCDNAQSIAAPASYAGVEENGKGKNREQAARVRSTPHGLAGGAIVAAIKAQQLTKYLTTQEVAGRLSVSVRLVLGWIRDNQLPAIDVSRCRGSGRPSWRVLRSEVERFELARAASPPPPAHRRCKKRSGQYTNRWYGEGSQ